MELFAGNVASLAAIDMHVHLEPETDNAVDAAAKKYFGDSGAARDRKGMAEYFRSRKIGFVVFTVDENSRANRSSATMKFCASLQRTRTSRFPSSALTRIEEPRAWQKPSGCSPVARCED